MALISTFGTYSIAKLGIYAASKALEVTGHNITNVQTPGYSRQALEQESLHMASADRYVSGAVLHMGTGVMAPSVSQARDVYLDIRYRNENTNVGNLASMTEGLDNIASILDEVGMGDDGEGVLEGLFNDAIDQMNALAAEGAGKDQYDTLFRSSMSTLTRQLNLTASNLSNLKSIRADRLDEDIARVNEILGNIRELNTTIRKCEIYGDNALEQRDKRNVLLDELSTYMQINVEYGEEELGPNLTVEKIRVTTGNFPLPTDPEKAEEALTKVKAGAIPERILIDGLYASEVLYRDGAESGKAVNPNGGEDYNYDLNLAELTDIHGGTVVLAENDLGVVKNRDIGAVEDEDGVIIRYRNLDEAEEAAAELTKDAVATEFFAETEEDGSFTVHEYGTTVYTSSEDAAHALDEIKKDHNKHVNSLGQVMRYDLRIIETNGLYEIHQFAVFRGEIQTGDTEFSGALLADRELLTEKGIFASQADLDMDSNAASKRGIPYYQKSLDALANKLAAVLNEANQLPDETVYESTWVESVDQDGNVVRTLEFIDADGNIVTGDKSRYQRKEEYSDYSGGILLSNHSNSNDDTGITAANISISRNWANGSFRVLRSTEPNPPSTAKDNLTHMCNVLTGSHEFYANAEDVYEKAATSEVFFTGSFQSLMTDHVVAHLASDQRNANIMYENWTVSCDEVYVNRDGVMGVDLNDEAMNLMAYQRSFAAACRLMTAFDEMIDRLVNGMAT